MAPNQPFEALAACLALRWAGFRVPIAGALLAGFAVAWGVGQLPLTAVPLALAAPPWSGRSSRSARPWAWPCRC